jgi:hypothetical protein
MDEAVRRFMPRLALAWRVCGQGFRNRACSQKQLIGMSEVGLQSCLGVPDRHASFGDTDVLTYDATSSSSDIPDHRRHVLHERHLLPGNVPDKGQTRYASTLLGEEGRDLVPTAYCAPIARACLEHLQGTQPVSQTAPDARIRRQELRTTCHQKDRCDERLARGPTRA